jgi:hypothetical protein
MHIGNTRKQSICNSLYIDDMKEKDVTSVETGTIHIKDVYESETILATSLGEKYLGDQISVDGKNDLNIAARRNRGAGLKNKIYALLVEMMAGDEHFLMATLLRNSCLVSSMIFNCEAWYGLTLKQVKILEREDENLMRKVLGCPSKTPIHLMYLELGWLPIRFIIQSRRLNFLKYVLDTKETSLVKQVFNEQISKPQKSDWVNIVAKDMRKLKITLTHEEITLMSKNMFKQIVKQKCGENGLEYLKHCIKSKGKEINYEKLEMRNYLASESFLTLQEKKEAFMIRTRMTEVKTNYKNKHNDYNCVAREKKNNYNEETQEHIYYCHEIKHYSEEFGNVFKDTHETKVIKQITKQYTKKHERKEKVTTKIEMLNKIAISVDQVVRLQLHLGLGTVIMSNLTVICTRVQLE